MFLTKQRLTAYFFSSASACAATAVHVVAAAAAAKARKFELGKSKVLETGKELINEQNFGSINNFKVCSIFWSFQNSSSTPSVDHKQFLRALA
jgi:hypothetical protein